jgi:hypothetical protein
LLGIGMGVTAAPATGEIMSAVPLSKAGVGSAVNDTTRELGGALGIAILGSIANSAYRASVDFAGVPLGAAVRKQASDSIGSAAQAAGGAAGHAVRTHATAAFTDAFNLTSVVSIAIVLAAAVGVLLASRAQPDDAIDLDDEAFELDITAGALAGLEPAE